jgi:uncharacterized membrane protein YgcG
MVVTSSTKQSFRTRCPYHQLRTSNGRRERMGQMINRTATAHRKIARRLAPVAIVAILGIVTAACGSSSGGSTTGGQSHTTTSGHSGGSSGGSGGSGF